jgi:hypothetical protein
MKFVCLAKVRGGPICSLEFVSDCSTCRQNIIHVSSEFSRSKGHLVSTEIFVTLLSFVFRYIVNPTSSMSVRNSPNFLLGRLAQRGCIHLNCVIIMYFFSWKS